MKRGQLLLMMLLALWQGVCDNMVDMSVSVNNQVPCFHTNFSLKTDHSAKCNWHHLKKWLVSDNSTLLTKYFLHLVLCNDCFYYISSFCLPSHISVHFLLRVPKQICSSVSTVLYKELQYLTNPNKAKQNSNLLKLSLFRVSYILKVNYFFTYDCVSQEHINHIKDMLKAWSYQLKIIKYIIDYALFSFSIVELLQIQENVWFRWKQHNDNDVTRCSCICTIANSLPVLAHYFQNMWEQMKQCNWIKF